MEHNNYSKYSQKSENNEVVETVVEKNDAMEEVFNQVMDEIVTPNPVEENEENVIETVETKGVVEGCSKLNVREEADKDSRILCIIDKAAEVIVDLENSTEDFYKVCTSSGVEGYCMKKYIEIK